MCHLQYVVVCISAFIVLKSSPAAVKNTTKCPLPKLYKAMTGQEMNLKYVQNRSFYQMFSFFFYECPGPDEPTHFNFCCNGSCCDSEVTKPKLKPNFIKPIVSQKTNCTLHTDNNIQVLALP